MNKRHQCVSISFLKLKEDICTFKTHNRRIFLNKHYFNPFNSHIKITLANVHLTASNYILIHNMISACINTPTLKSYILNPRYQFIALKLQYCRILYILQIPCTALCSIAVDLNKERAEMDVVKERTHVL